MEAEGFPNSVKEVFRTSEYNVFKEVKLLAGFVEHQVPLSAGGHPSQNDIFVIAKGKEGLVAIVVEGKVSESFGEIVGNWKEDESKGKALRLKRLTELLELTQDNLQGIRYQLIHRTASAVIEAKRFNASTALMLVHSFSPKHKWFDDYKRFAYLFGIEAQLNAIHFARRIENVDLYLAWIIGEEKYLAK
jgi:hypothetical protein